MMLFKHDDSFRVGMRSTPSDCSVAAAFREGIKVKVSARGSDSAQKLVFPESKCVLGRYPEQWVSDVRGNEMDFLVPKQFAYLLPSQSV